MKAIDQGGGIDAKDVCAGLGQTKIEIQIRRMVALALHTPYGEPARPADHKRADQERRIATFRAPEPLVVTCSGLDQQAERGADDIGLGISSPGVEQGGAPSRQPEIIMIDERERFATRAPRPALRAAAALALSCRIKTTSGCSRRTMSSTTSDELSSTTMISSTGSVWLFTLRSASERKRAPL
ncbi:MAG TPA: hypothetical protein VF886_13385 [Roseiarcus sp.]